MLNGWRFKAADKDGKPVESAPGMTTFTAHGPTSLKEMKAAAKLFLDNKRRDAIRDGEPDPGYAYVEDSFVKLEPIDEFSAPVTKPAGAVPVKLPSEVRAEAKAAQATA